MSLAVWLLTAQLLHILITPTIAKLVYPDMTPVISFMQEFIQPFVPFVDRLLHPSRSAAPKDAMTADEQEIASFINKKVARVKPKDRVGIVEIIKQRSDDAT